MAMSDVNGVRLLVHDAGRGDSMVLVHGSWDDRQAWMFVEEELAKSFRVVTYDRRGHTGSEDAAEGGTRRDDEDDLEALVEALDLAPVHLVGSSFGASVSLGLTARRPELVRSVCAHEPPLLALAADDPGVARFREHVRPVVAAIDRGDVEAGARLFLDQVMPGAWKTMPPAAQAAMVANAGTFSEETRDPAWSALDVDALAAAAVPILLTVGDASPEFFAPIVDALEERVPGVQVTTLRGAGHVPHLTHPTEWLAVVQSFAEKAG